jgi:hypothetical protein
MAVTAVRDRQIARKLRTRVMPATHRELPNLKGRMIPSGLATRTILIDCAGGIAMSESCRMKEDVTERLIDIASKMKQVREPDVANNRAEQESPHEC